jgi:enoyl-CoA hydratase/carnithine racemase
MTSTTQLKTPVIDEKRNPNYWRVTLDNPPINLFDPEMIAGLQSLVEQLEHDDQVKVVVFDSADPDYFIAQALAAVKEIINQRVGLVPPSELVATQKKFFEVLARPETQARVASLMQRGLQQRGDLELRLGYHLATQ